MELYYICIISTEKKYVYILKYILKKHILIFAYPANLFWIFVIFNNTFILNFTKRKSKTI